MRHFLFMLICTYLFKKRQEKWNLALLHDCDRKILFCDDSHFFNFLWPLFKIFAPSCKQKMVKFQIFWFSKKILLAWSAMCIYNVSPTNCFLKRVNYTFQFQWFSPECIPPFFCNLTDPYFLFSEIPVVDIERVTATETV